MCFGTPPRMLFNTPEYGLFFVVTALLYWALPHRGQNALLLAASCLFYGWWDWRFLFLLLGSAVVDFSMARRITRARTAGNEAGARRALTFSVIANLSVLACFKYFDFFIDSAGALLRGLGYDGSLWTLNVILPVGISFYTFQTMSYTIDVYRGQIQPTRRLLELTLFVAFFPQLVAGPIERASSLLSQIERPRRLLRRDVEDGVLLFALGLFRKVAIADPAGAIADTYFAEPTTFTTVPLVTGLLLYSVQIYNDFAGYSDMARGSARLLGFRLTRNFRHPYFAGSFSEFWTRWHVTLSAWLRDYLYIPLGGNRRGARRTYVNLMITMLLGGLWHGAAWTFVVWGALHGTYLVAQHVLQQYGPARLRGAAPVRASGAAHVWRAARMSGVFLLVTFTWLFFRSPDFATAAAYVAGIAALTPGYEGALLPFVVLAAFTLAIDVPQAASGDEFVFLDGPVVARALTAAACIMLLLTSGSANEPFIYFQF